HARLFYIDRSCRPMMAGKALQVEKTPGEVGRHIDRTHGVPAIQAAMGGDHGIEQLAHIITPGSTTKERCPDVTTAPGKVVGRGYCEVGMQICRDAREVPLDSRLEILIHQCLVSLV